MIPVPHSQRSLERILPAACDAVGLGSGLSRDVRADRMALDVPEAARVCVVVVDGLGWLNVSARFGHAATLRSWHAAEPLMTVVPSTTAAAITAVGTGLRPGQNAMLSYELRSPATGKNFSLISWEQSGMDPRTWQSQPTLFESLGEEAAHCALVQQASFVGSGLTLAALRGARTIVAEGLEARVRAASSALHAGTKLVYLYWGELDHIGHKRGWNSSQWTRALEELDAGMALLERSVPRGTLILLTADHGMIDVTERIDVAQFPTLLDGVSLVSGEERALHLYADDPDAVAARWEAQLGDVSWIATKKQALAGRVFGATSEFAASVMGDVLVFQKSTFALVDSRMREPGRPFMVGVHGSVTEPEMMVPLLMALT